MKRFLILWLILLTLSWQLLPAWGARTFAVASAQYLHWDSPVVTTGNFTVAAWFRVSSDTENEMTIWSVGRSDSENDRYSLQVRGSSASRRLEFQMRTPATGTQGAFTGTTGYTVGTWTHAVGWRAATDDRRVRINNTAEGQNTASATPSGMNQSRIGARAVMTVGQYFAGDLAHVAVWDVAPLSEPELAALAIGVNPRHIRPQNLISYVPIWGVHSTEIDLVGGMWTLVNAPPIGPTGPPVGLFSSTLGR